MSVQVINSRCRCCGSWLEIYPDMSRFACGQCGTEFIVERRGGTISVKSALETTDRAQGGTDKIAAELALVRLERELAGARQGVSDKPRDESQIRILREDLERWTMVGIVSTIAAPICFFKVDTILGTALAGVAVLMGICRYGTLVNLREADGTTAKRRRIVDLEQQLYEKRRIADS